MVANLGFFDQEDNEGQDAQIDPIFSQSQTIEEVKDMTTEESKESVKKQHPAQPKTKEEIQAKFTEEEHERVQEMFNAEIGFT